MTLFPLLLVWLKLVLFQEQWRLVHRDGSVEAAWGTPQLAQERRSDLVTAWMWSGVQVPRRVSPADVGRQRSGDQDAGRLAVRIARRAGGKAPEDLRLFAAPRAMWSEVPEAALPAWPVPKDGKLSIPLDPGQPWRLRVAGRGEGSWWIDVRPGQKSVAVTSAPASGVEISVVEARGKPVIGVTGSFQEAAGRGGQARGWALLRAESGNLTAPGLPDEGEVSLTVMAAGAAPLVLRGRPSALPHRVELAAGAELSGRLIDRRGAPVGGVPVAAESWASSDLPQVFVVRSQSAPDGVWHLRGLPPGKIAWSARPHGFVPLAETLEIQAGASQDLGTRTLDAGRTLAVSVIDETGAPVPGAAVQGSAGRFSAVADAGGVALLAGLPEAPLEIKGTAPGHLPAGARFNAPFPAAPQLVLPRCFTITGRLVDATGAPILRGTARVDARSSRDETPLGDGGRFRLDLPPERGGAELVLLAPAIQELRVRIAAGKSGEVRDLGDLHAQTGLAVIGRVVRAADGAPLPGARVWTTRQGADGPAVAWASRDLLEAVTQEDGRFQLSGLLPAPAVLRVEAAGFSRTQLNLPLTGAEGDDPGSLIDLGSIALATGATLHVRVEDKEAAGAVARADLGNRWLEPDMLTAQLWDGEAALMNVPAGKVTVSVLSGRRLLCEQVVLVQDGGEQDVDCRRAAVHVSGLVQIGGASAGPGTIAWHAPANEVPSRIDTAVSPAGLRQYQVTGAGRPQVNVAVGADGRFETDELTPGRWRVTWLVQGSASSEIIVDIPEAEHFEAVLPFPGMAVTGTVTDREGQPVEGARVRDLASSALAITSAGGGFSLTGLKTGKALLQASREEETSPVRELSLQEGEAPSPVQLVLSTQDTPTVTVTVTDTAGAPRSGAFVFLEEEGKGQRLITTGPDGRATATLSAPLAARIRAAAFFSGTWGFGRWETRETARQGLSVEIGGAGTLLVRSAKSHGSPRIMTQSGWDLSWLLRQLGTPPELSPERPLLVAGLASGLYLVSLDSTSVTLDVSGSRPAEGKLEE